MKEYDVTVVMHIDENLTDSQIHQLEHDLAYSPGIRSACVNERTRHLMLVDYDPQQAYASDILNTVKYQGYHAELIGF
ncbi:heavy-metal-associated domain-containing protein [Candidatus Thiothrix sp. Deng01]|uniref:Heavy-metal-associated domain-containing protein n=2 Tax=Thiothrix TaxID=1030 RepID=A0A7L6ANQ4_9GAMM|nr:heavy-metal-associated domain-containing protein [Candidatus Thiothrix sp. Deng01]MEB4589868.1 heavy-metal-associated domain-containing protein [Candidatus Thiothrix sp. Deng01]QLQ30736.1 MAG: heavy-metal-associated domain-containing protein [Candidatus Thiothrix singaporensis]